MKLLIVALLVVIGFVASLLSPHFTSATEELPNILLIISDDQRFDQNKYMPRIMSQIAKKGLIYDRAYVSTPLCCPSRAALYTGQYNSRNKVMGNNFPLEGPTIFKDLQDRYYTGIVGKYLNSHNGTPLPEFDYWAVHPYGSVGYRRQKFNINGRWRIYNGSVLARMQLLARKFIKEAKQQNQPWLLTYALFHPHAPAIADERDRGRFAKEKYDQRANYRVTSQDKPAYIRHSKLNAERTREFQERQKDTIYSMDRDVNNLLWYLKMKGELDNTVVIFLSDNGIFHGEHNLTSKVAPYEEATRVPLFIRYDRLIKEPRVYTNLVGLIDVTATLYELTNTTPGHILDGVSLLPTFTDNQPVRETLLLEGWKNGWRYRESFFGIHTGTQVLINNEKDISEFYNLENDPYQLYNLYNNQRSTSELQSLQTRLNQLVINTRGALDFNLPIAQKVKPDKNSARP